MTTVPRRQADTALPDLRGRTALVTGASDGVGLEIARALAAAGGEVLLPVRDRTKGDRAVARIRSTVPDARLSLLDLDLARLETVSALTAQLRREGGPIDLLVLNAGMIGLGERERHITGDGFELHFQTNYLGHVALTLGLLPLLSAGHARVVVQTSLAARFARFDERDPQIERRYSALRAYGSSKVALGLFATELARREIARQWGLTVHLAHPGVAPSTGIAPHVRARRDGGVLSRVVRRVGNTPAQAAQPALLAAISTQVPPTLFAPSGFGQLAGPPRPVPLYRSFRDWRRAARLWDWTRSLLPDPD
ncbi:SDR family oxidoreductase [Microbacterium sp. MC2]